MRLFGLRTSNQTTVAEKGTDLGRQVHGLSYKAAFGFWCWTFERDLELGIYSRGPGGTIEA
ncbi:unnamed protein product [Prunus brigantina]